MDELEVQVEVSENVFSDEIRRLEDLNRRITKALESALGVQMKVR